MWIAAGLVILILLALLWPNASRRASAHTFAAGRACQHRDWPDFERQMELARQALGRMRSGALRDEMRGEIDLVAAQAAYWQGNLDQTIVYARSSIAHLERSASPYRGTHISLASHLRGDAHFDRAELDQAVEQFRVAAQAVSFDRDPSLAIFSLQRLSDALLEQQRFAEARSVIEQCVRYEHEVATAALEREGKDPGATPVVAMTAPDLSLANRDFAQAERLFREKVEFWSKMSARPDSIDVTRYLFHLATAIQAQGRKEEAIETLRQACQRAELDFGAAHPRTCRARAKLAAIVES